MNIFKEFTFEAAHKLPHVPTGHKCGRLHGHSYRAEIHVEGKPNHVGWVMDFSEIKASWEWNCKELDHSYLNEIPGLENPTSENLAKWIFQRMHGAIYDVTKVVVRETCTSGAMYTIDDFRAGV